MKDSAFNALLHPVGNNNIVSTNSAASTDYKPAITVAIDKFLKNGLHILSQFQLLRIFSCVHYIVLTNG